MDGRLTFTERRRIAQAVRRRTAEIAASVTDEFFARHPEWHERYGAAGVERGIEDARFHLDFLTGAIAAGSTDAFARYIAWASRVLESRGIATHFLHENLRQISLEAGRGLSSYDAEVIARYVETAIEHVPAETDPSIVSPALPVYVAAAIGGNRRAALNITLEMLREGSTVIDVYSDLLQAAQYEVGRLWEHNRISVAQEHMATAVTQYVVAQLYSRLPVAETPRGNAVVTGVQGELHQLGANMVADMWEAHGWNVRFLGTQLPHAGILEVIDEHKPNVVGISTTMLFNIDKVAQLVSDIRAGAERTCIIVGGGAFRSSPDLWKEIDADGMASDLRESLHVVDACLSSSRT